MRIVCDDDVVVNKLTTIFFINVRFIQNLKLYKLTLFMELIISRMFFT
jgi:hypothetical protein